jgi:3-deoxy-7-phosphoheptulonate synthase
MPTEEATSPVWSPISWQAHSALQQPAYPDPNALREALEELGRLPPLVTSWEIVELQRQLAEAAEGQRFILQAGDCAERFADCSPQRITNKLKVLLQMSLVLVQGSAKPVVRIGRFAGQYAKPRSADFEERDGVRLPCYRGDIINRPEFTEEARRADPELLLRGYERAALTLNFVRALVKGGFADLHHPEYWDLDWAAGSPQAHEYRRIVSGIGSALQFMENILGVRAGDTDRIDFFSSHEALHLGYESALTRTVPHRKGWFNLSTHMPWIGIRTACPEGAHVEYMRGIRNPIGMKVGSATQPDELVRVCEILNPGNEPGRLTLIHRFGADRIADGLPKLLERLRSAGCRAGWVCDPMHGNTRTTSSGFKTRSLQDIEREIAQAFDIHHTLGVPLAGVHIELTGENVTECTGGARGLAEQDLSTAYETEVDPRLNYEQSIELAMLIAGLMANRRNGKSAASQG